MNQQILIISTEYPPGPGGIGQHAYSLSKALHTEGYNVHVLSPADYATPDEINDFDRCQPFKIDRYARKGQLLTYMIRLLITRSTIRRIQPSAVILSGKFSLWQGLLIKRFYPKIKTLAILHGSEVNLAKPLLKCLTHQSIDAADTIISVSKFTKSLLPDWIQRKHPNIQVIPNGIDMPVFSEERNSHIPLNGTPRLLTVGHVSPRKGQHRVINALPKLIAEWPKLHYHIVGRPINKAELEAKAIQLGVRDHITFHGRVPQHHALGKYYSQADVFMLLSENQPDGDVEGFGIVALEANLNGLPVVGAKYCGVEEAVSHMMSGYLVDGDNPNEILEGVKYCLANKEYLEKGAKAWVQAHQWPSIISQYSALLD